MSAQMAVYGGMAALEIAGGYFAAQNIRDTARLNRDIAEMNAQFAEWDAYDSEIEGYTAQTRYQSVIDNTLAEQKVGMLAAGMDVNYGSASSIAEETKFIGELNKMEIVKRAEEQVLGYNRQARDIRMQSNMNYNSSMTQAGQVMYQSVLGAAKTGASGYMKSR